MIRKEAVKTVCTFLKDEIIVSANGLISRDVYSSLDKNSNISGKLTGIKGQYLYLNKVNVFNIRKHQGYLVDFNIY